MLYCPTESNKNIPDPFPPNRPCLNLIYNLMHWEHLPFGLDLKLRFAFLHGSNSPADGC